MATEDCAGFSRRSFLQACPGLALAGCVAVGGTQGGPPAPARAYRVGDRWVYRISDGFRVPVTWEETHEVVAADAARVVVRITGLGPTTNFTREEQLAAPGIVRVGAVFDRETRRFDPPLERFRFPLVSGTSWNQRPNNFNETTQQSGQISYFVTVGGWDTLNTPAGTFEAIRLRLIMRLDDEDPFRLATECNYLQWYAPEAGALVREEKQAQYRLRGDGSLASIVRSQNATVELVRHARGPG